MSSSCCFWWWLLFFVVVRYCCRLLFVLLQHKGSRREPMNKLVVVEKRVFVCVGAGEDFVGRRRRNVQTAQQTFEFHFGEIPTSIFVVFSEDFPGFGEKLARFRVTNQAAEILLLQDCVELFDVDGSALVSVQERPGHTDLFVGKAELLAQHLPQLARREDRVGIGVVFREKRAADLLLQYLTVGVFPADFGAHFSSHGVDIDSSIRVLIILIILFYFTFSNLDLDETIREGD